MSTAFFDTLVSRVKRLFRQIRGFFPEALPVGMAEFDAWVESIASTYNLPTFDQDSLKFALGSVIMHLGPTAAYKSKFYFALVLHSGAAKQIAGAQFQQVKQRQQEAAKAAAEAAKQKTAEATAPSVDSVANAVLQQA